MNRLTVLGALQPRYDLTWCADKLRRISVGLIRDFMCWMKFTCRSDDSIDRLSHVYTVCLLVLFAVLVTTSQFVGDAIHCWCPGHFTDAYVAYTKNYCWIRNTYYIPMTETIPVHVSTRQVGLVRNSFTFLKNVLSLFSSFFLYLEAFE